MLNMKGTHTRDNDNEPDTMIPIGLAALELLNRLRAKMDLLDLMEGEEKQAERSNEGTGEKKEDEQRDQQSDRYIEHRLRELREFERRARGK